jgi:hypothetical protein
MDMNDEQRKQLIKERDRIRHYEKYHTDENKRRYQIEYELRRRREDPEYKARYNARRMASYYRKKELMKANENKENVPMDVPMDVR